MIPYTIFIVDDEPTVREGIVMALGEAYRMEGFSNAEDALSAMRKEAPDLVLLDVGLPGMDGIGALEEIKRSHGATPVIMITAYEDIDTVVSTMKLGAYDYITKPIHMDTLDVTIRNALDTIRLRKEVHLLQERYLEENIACFIGESNAIQNVMEFITLVAKSPDTPILIVGETGTGKELIASAVHYRSPNFRGPFIPVNCAAIPKDLIESELFGYETGAFSGARAGGKKGLIEEAENGTLFLDEIGDLGLDAQAKLLRFLETGEFYRVGGTKKHKIHTRLVSATNQDLDDLIQKYRFRKDLYFRIGVVKVEVPTLNDRPEDIVAIAKHFLLAFSQKFEKAFTGLSPQTEAVLSTHRWTGNVRELKNMIERGVLVGKGPELTPHDLGMADQDPSNSSPSTKAEMILDPLTDEGVDFVRIQESIERHYIRQALQKANGNESKAARLLNMNHHTFRYRKKKLQIE
jgi:DNA-binding NtrC family response regulator